MQRNFNSLIEDALLEGSFCENPETDYTMQTREIQYRKDYIFCETVYVRYAADNRFAEPEHNAAGCMKTMQKSWSFRTGAVHINCYSEKKTRRSGRQAEYFTQSHMYLCSTILQRNTRSTP